MGTSLSTDRRGTGDRRSRRLCIYYPERRRGFERRRPADGLLLRARWTVLDRYRDDGLNIALVLAAIVLLSLADLLLTLRALELGASEANPVMARLIDIDPVLAALFKLSITAVVGFTIWFLRRYRQVLEVSLLIAGGLTLVLGYHLIGALILSA